MEFISQLYNDDLESKTYNFTNYDATDLENFMKDTAPELVVLRVWKFALKLCTIFSYDLFDKCRLNGMRCPMPELRWTQDGSYYFYDLK